MPTTMLPTFSFAGPGSVQLSFHEKLKDTSFTRESTAPLMLWAVHTVLTLASVSFVTEVPYTLKVQNEQRILSHLAREHWTYESSGSNAPDAFKIYAQVSYGSLFQA